MPKVTRSGMSRAQPGTIRKDMYHFCVPVNTLFPLPALPSMEIRRARYFSVCGAVSFPVKSGFVPTLRVEKTFQYLSHWFGSAWPWRN